MGPHFLGNFLSPASPLGAGDIEPPRQIAYYSYFQGNNEYKYHSREALKLFQRPSDQFSFAKADEPTLRKIWDDLDSLLRPGLWPIKTSCERANCTGDLSKANVITRRGTLVEYACSLVFLTAS